MIAEQNRNYMKSKVWSNIFFGIPLLIAIWNQLFFHTVLIIFVMFFSSMYHLHDEKKYKTIDRIFACILISYNLYLWYLSNFIQPYFSIVLFSVFIGLYIKLVKKSDDLGWHLASAIITTFCILGYVYRMP